MTRRPRSRLFRACLTALSHAIFAVALAAQEVPVSEFTLENGMTFLVAPRKDSATALCGFAARVGSANERPGITGLAHLFEHLLFKGTRTIGTTNAERDLEIIAAQERVKDAMRAEDRAIRERVRRGEIDDPASPAARSERYRELEAEFERLVREQRRVLVPDEFDRLLSEAGAADVNAFTSEDMTVYYCEIPVNKLELWFWLESERLRDPVLREFYAERDVVAEERRQRTESTPTGPFDETFESLFWEAHPYSWPIIGWPSDLANISKRDADEFFATYYAPNNLGAVVAGNVDVAAVRALAERYFGRLERAPAPPPDVVTIEPSPSAEKRMLAAAETNPSVEIRWKTVPWGHRDSFALGSLAAILNGQSGRLYARLVERDGVATDADAIQYGLKYAGYFAVSGTCRKGVEPDALERALLREIESLAAAEAEPAELEKVKNQSFAESVRRLRSSHGLGMELLEAFGYGDWRAVNEHPRREREVTLADVRRAAAKYLRPDVRAVATFVRKKGTGAYAAAEEGDAALAGLDPEARRIANAILEEMEGLDPEELALAIEDLEAALEEAPDEARPAIRHVLKKLAAKPAGPGGEEKRR